MSIFKTANASKTTNGLQSSDVWRGNRKRMRIRNRMWMNSHHSHSYSHSHSHSELWTRWGSNPRPNKEFLSFLHAYPAIGFRCRLAHRQANSTLSLCFLATSYKLQSSRSPFDEASLYATRSGVIVRDSACPNLSEGIKRNHTRWLGCKRIRSVVISDL